MYEKYFVHYTCSIILYVWFFLKNVILTGKISTYYDTHKNENFVQIFPLITEQIPSCSLFSLSLSSVLSSVLSLSLCSLFSLSESLTYVVVIDTNSHPRVNTGRSHMKRPIHQLAARNMVPVA